IDYTSFPFAFFLFFSRMIFTAVRMAPRATRVYINAPKAPAVQGPFSHAVRVGDTVYLSGQLGYIPETNEMIEGGIEEQTHQTLRNLGEVLKAAGVGYGDVVRTTVLLASMDDLPRVNVVYKQYFKDNYPTRTAFQVAGLYKKGLIEIDAIAIESKEG
ncbi:hypothetical protein PFISCL1PPCAC_12072, partial [Pristionchus fissidentatus]